MQSPSGTVFYPKDGYALTEKSAVINGSDCSIRVYPFQNETQHLNQNVCVRMHVHDIDIARLYACILTS